MPQAYCGGGGVCGKCRVDVTADGETRSQLACRTRVYADATVRIPKAGEADILTSGAGHAVAITPRSGFSAAFDIGTTTVVCYLLSGEDGRQLFARGMLNPQSSFGADVVTRAQHALSHGGAPLQRAVVSAMNRLLMQCCEDAGVSPQSVSHCAVVGNTAMQHLLLGISPEPLVRAPYLPLSCEAVMTTAGALGLAAHPDATVRILPLIAGFVGADTVGCLLATDFPSLAGNTLLMDVGTNGELVMGNGVRRIACSTAAGPAFEGAKLLCGMRGETGAIDHAALKDGTLRYTVIGGGKPKGVCGSGLIDLVACLLSAGTIAPDGRMLDDGAFSERVLPLPDGMRAFTIARADETLSGEPVLLTQQDVRELQLAKAAMAAGVRLLADTLGVALSAIDRVLVAGAFGSCLDSGSACAIGLIPAVLRDRVESISNAAGEGAKLAAASDEACIYADALAKGTEYLELAGLPAFQERFVAELPFPEAAKSD